MTCNYGDGYSHCGKPATERLSIYVGNYAVAITTCPAHKRGATQTLRSIAQTQQ